MPDQTEIRPGVFCNGLGHIRIMAGGAWEIVDKYKNIDHTTCARIKMPEEEETDFTLQDTGSVLILKPESNEAVAWVDMYIGRDNGYQPYWPAVIIERRYVEDILEGIQADGLSVR